MDTPNEVGAKRKVRGKPFEKGNRGRPRGARNKRTVILEQLIDGQAKAIVSKAVEKALDGDSRMLGFLCERVLGPRGERFLPNLKLPPIQSVDDCAEASAAVVAAISTGKITLAEGMTVLEMVGMARQAFETREIVDRISYLEETSIRDNANRSSRSKNSPASGSIEARLALLERAAESREAVNRIVRNMSDVDKKL